MLIFTGWIPAEHDCKSIPNRRKIHVLANLYEFTWRKTLNFVLRYFFVFYCHHITLKDLELVIDLGNLETNKSLYPTYLVISF